MFWVKLSSDLLKVISHQVTMMPRKWLSSLQTPCDMNRLVTSGFPSQTTAIRSLDIFFIVSSNKLMKNRSTVA